MVASTTVQIKNDTGETVNFVTSHDYHGHIKPGTAYPAEIKNGQTVEFLFKNTKVTQNGESSGAVVYRGKNEKGKELDWTYSWSNVDGADEETFKAYTEIAAANHYKTEAVWDEVRKDLMRSDNSSSDEFNKCVSEATISKPRDVVYEGRMFLK